MARKVYFDGLFLTGHLRNTGKGRYLFNLLKQIERLTQESDQLVSCVLVPPNTSGEACGLTPRKGFELIHTRAMLLRRIWRRGFSTVMAKAMRCEVLFVPEAVPILVKPRKLVVNLHDVEANLFPHDFRSARNRIERWATVSHARNADLIFTDSEYTKNAIVSVWNVPPERIVVTYLGVDRGLFKSDRLTPSEREVLAERYGLKHEYILYVGAAERKKNLARLIRAHLRLRQQRKDLEFDLVLCGRPGEGYHEIAKLCEEAGPRDRPIFTGCVPEHDLTLLYRGATCLALPSFHEGFGLPVVEAMASGIPVISSNRSCLPEIGGDAAIYFDPLSEEEIVAALERLMTDPELRECLRNRGLERAKRFTWESCARTTLAALERL